MFPRSLVLVQTEHILMPFTGHLTLKVSWNVQKKTMKFWSFSNEAGLKWDIIALFYTTMVQSFGETHI